MGNFGKKIAGGGDQPDFFCPWKLDPTTIS